MKPAADGGATPGDSEISVPEVVYLLDGAWAFFFFLKGEGCRILTITVSTVLMIMIVLTTLMVMIGLKNMTLTTMLTVLTSVIIS